MKWTTSEHRDDDDDDDDYDDDDDASRVARARTSADIPRGAMTRDETTDDASIRPERVGK